MFYISCSTDRLVAFATREDQKEACEYANTLTSRCGGKSIVENNGKVVFSVDREDQRS